MVIYYIVGISILWFEIIKKHDRGIFRRASSRALILNTARKNLKRIQVRTMNLTHILFLI